MVGTMLFLATVRCNKGTVLQGQCWSLELCVVLNSHFNIGSVLLVKLCMIVIRVRYCTVGSTPLLELCRVISKAPYCRVSTVPWNCVWL